MTDIVEDIVDRLRVLNFMGPWQEAADEIERLRLANSDLQMHYDYAKTEYDKLREVLESVEGWVERWTKHVGSCLGGLSCTCGRTFVLFQINEALKEKE